MLATLNKMVWAAAVWAVVVALHAPLLNLPYFWDEAGYYVPAALDFFRYWLLIPVSTQPSGHTPLVSVYLSLVWHLAGYSPLATRSAMLLIAAGTVIATSTLARKIFRAGPSRTPPEAAIWCGVLLALAPLFFVQSSMVHLDLAVALLTTIAIIALLEDQWTKFAVSAAMAVLAKETAIVMLPAAWIFVWLEARRNRGAVSARVWLILASPGLVLAAWAIYYHHRTGFWNGNADYLQYNLYATLSPVRILLCLLRRLQEVFIAGFSWILTAAALIAYRYSRKGGAGRGSHPGSSWGIRRRFILLTTLLTAAYLGMLSIVGGAVLARYILPLCPPLIALAMLFVWRLPRRWARICCVLAAAGLVTGWFTNPPYPFPFEDNLAYADFVRLHQRAAAFLSTSGAPGTGTGARILTAWPATNELTTPDLGYVAAPLQVTPMEGFAPADFASVKPGSFDLVYVYSRKWEPPGNWLTRFRWIERLEVRYFDYAPQLSPKEIESRLNLRLVARWERRGQWAAIYRLAGK